MRLRTGIVALALLAVPLGAVRAESNELASAARSLAENVLGAGSVTSLAVADRGATILIRWESATFRPNQKVDAVRDGLVAEAQLATGSILGRLYTVSRVKFSIKRADAVLATGENSRSGGLKLTFAAPLGGGMFLPKPAAKQRSGGGVDAVKD